MKKLKVILSFSLMGVLLAATLGFSVSRHYCMGMLVAENFYSLDDASCGMEGEDDCGGAELHWDCCDSQELSISGIEILSVTDDEDEKSFFTSSLSPSFALQFSHQYHTDTFSQSDAPPGMTGRSILILHQRFLI